MSKVVPSLNLNKHPREIQNGSLVNALNVQLSKDGTTFTNEHSIIENEKINKFISGQKIVGVIETSHELIIFTEYNIYRYNEDYDDIYCAIHNYDYGGGEIKGTFTYNTNNDLIIIFCEYNSKIKQPVKSINIGLWEEKETVYNKQYLFPLVSEVIIPTISSTSIDSYWHKGWSFVYIRYKINNKGDYTQWYNTNFNYLIDSISENNINGGVALVYDNEKTITNENKKDTLYDAWAAVKMPTLTDIYSDDSDFSSKSINLNLYNLDTRYDYYQLAVINVRKDKTNVYNTDDILISNNNIKLDTINFKFNDFSIDDVVYSYINYFNAKTITSYRNRVYIGNYEEKPVENLIDFVKNNCKFKLNNLLYTSNDDYFGNITIPNIMGYLFRKSYYDISTDYNYLRYNLDDTPIEGTEIQKPLISMWFRNRFKTNYNIHSYVNWGERIQVYNRSIEVNGRIKGNVFRSISQPTKINDDGSATINYITKVEEDNNHISYKYITNIDVIDTEESAKNDNKVPIYNNTFGKEVILTANINGKLNSNIRTVGGIYELWFLDKEGKRLFHSKIPTYYYKGYIELIYVNKYFNHLSTNSSIIRFCLGNAAGDGYRFDPSLKIITNFIFMAWIIDSEGKLYDSYTKEDKNNYLNISNGDWVLRNNDNKVVYIKFKENGTYYKTTLDSLIYCPINPEDENNTYGGHFYYAGEIFNTTDNYSTQKLKFLNNNGTSIEEIETINNNNQLSPIDRIANELYRNKINFENSSLYSFDECWIKPYIVNAEGEVNINNIKHEYYYNVSNIYSKNINNTGGEPNNIDISIPGVRKINISSDYIITKNIDGENKYLINLSDIIILYSSQYINEYYERRPNMDITSSPENFEHFLNNTIRIITNALSLKVTISGYTVTIYRSIRNMDNNIINFALLYFDVHNLFRKAADPYWIMDINDNKLYGIMNDGDIYNGPGDSYLTVIYEDINDPNKDYKVPLSIITFDTHYDKYTNKEVELVSDFHFYDNDNTEITDDIINKYNEEISKNNEFQVHSELYKSMIDSNIKYRNLIKHNTYKFYIHFIDKYGNSTNGYPLPNSSTDVNEKDYNQVRIPYNNFSVAYDPKQTFNFIDVTVDKIPDNYIGWFISFHSVKKVNFIGAVKALTNENLNAIHKFDKNDIKNKVRTIFASQQLNYKDEIKLDNNKCIIFGNTNTSSTINNICKNIVGAGESEHLGKEAIIILDDNTSNQLNIQNNIYHSAILENTDNIFISEDKLLIPCSNIFYITGSYRLNNTNDDNKLPFDCGGYYDGFRTRVRTFYYNNFLNINSTGVADSIDDNNNTDNLTQIINGFIGCIDTYWDDELPNEYKQINMKPLSIICNIPKPNDNEAYYKNYVSVYQALFLPAQNSQDLYIVKHATLKECYPSVLQNYRSNKTYKYIFNNRIIRTNNIHSESEKNYWRNITFDRYIDVTENKGEITNIFGKGSQFFVHSKFSAFVLETSNKMDTTAGGSIQVQEKDVFDTGYKEIIPSKLGTAGLDTYNSYILGQYGYLWYNSIECRFYIYTNGSIKTIDDNIKEWIKKYKLYDIKFAEDYENSRILISAKYSNNKNVIFSYNYLTNTFISLHNYKFNKGIITKNKLYLIENNKFYNFDDNKHSIFNMINEDFQQSKLSFIVNTEFDKIKFINYVIYKLFARAKREKNIYNSSPVEERTIDYSGNYIRIYNEFIDTGKISIEQWTNNPNDFGKPFRDLGNWNFNLIRNNNNLLWSDDIETMNEYYSGHTVKDENNKDILSYDTNSRLFGNYFIIEFYFTKLPNNIDKFEFEGFDIDLTTRRT